MKLSDLVAFRNQLDSLAITPIKTQANIEIEKVLNSIESRGENVDQHVEILKARQNTIIENFQKFEQEFSALKKDVNLTIAEHEEFWFEESYTQYQNKIALDLSQTILERRLSLTDEEQELFHSRISLYTSWQRPGLIIRPGRETLINQMVDSDPLYLVDRRSDLLEPAINGFNPVYQNRLCVYVVTEDINTEILQALPDNQFGIALVYNFFNYRPIEVIKKYLTEIYKKLQPGGCVIMTYNDCDYWQGVVLVEQNFCSYTPGHMVRDIARQIGYEFLHTIAINPANTWVELKKPGVITSLRGGQLLATPSTKPEAIELHRLQALAREFGMATTEVIAQYNKEQLVDLIIKSGKENLL